MFKQTLCAIVAALGIAGAAGCTNRTEYDCKDLMIGNLQVSFSSLVGPLGIEDTLIIVDKQGGVAKVVDYHNRNGEGEGQVDCIYYTDARGNARTVNRESDPKGMRYHFGEPIEIDAEYNRIKEQILAAKKK